MDTNPPILSAADVTEVVRHVVTQLAPDELEVVDAVADAWLADGLGNRRSKGAPGAAVGFGVESVLLGQMLFPIVSAAIGEVLGTIALEPSRLSRKRRKAKTEPIQGDSAVAGTVGGGLPVQLTAEQIEDLRASCQRHAQALGLSQAKAGLLADATLGALARR
jgi:hypothetical protein